MPSLDRAGPLLESAALAAPFSHRTRRGALGRPSRNDKIVQPDKAEAMISLQGAKMGRPSHVHISIGVKKGEINSVRVGGEAVLAGEATLYIT